MTLTSKDIEKIAHLARIKLEIDQIPAYTKKLSQVLDLASQMQAVNTEGISPLSHPLDATQRLREDQPAAENLRDTYQSVAPHVMGGFYLVPKVIE